MFRKVSKMSSIRDICVNSRQRWPSRRRRGSISPTRQSGEEDALSTCSLPQSYCRSRFSGNCTVWRRLHWWMALLRVRGRDRTDREEYACCAYASAAGMGVGPVESAMGCMGFVRAVSTVKWSTIHW